MNSRTLALSALLTCCLVPLAALAAGGTVRVVNGDATRGTALYGLHCASCHGADGRGGGALAPTLGTPAPPDLRDLAFLMQRSDDDLQQAIAGGGKARGGSFTMPAFGTQLAALDVWDLVAFVRQGQPSVGEYFPAAARFTAKTYTFDGDGVRRLEAALGKLSPEEGKIVLVTAFGGDKVEGDEPVYVPHDPRLLDALKPKQKLGYLAFGRVKLPNLPEIPVSLALNKDGAIAKISASLDAIPEKERANAAKLLAGYEGQGSKKSPYEELKAPGPAPVKGKKAPAKKDEPKGAAEAAKALSRTYLRTVEAAVQFDKEERERHWAD
ncbi:MAG TPA: cytochrome c [Myxococcales bacterium]|jgi:mono/diheme cytochrome c family protein